MPVRFSNAANDVHYIDSRPLKESERLQKVLQNVLLEQAMVNHQNAVKYEKMIQRLRAGIQAKQTRGL